MSGRQLMCVGAPMEARSGTDRIAALGVPRRLNFAGLLFYPLALLIDPVCRWRADLPAIPRSVVEPMAAHVRLAMGSMAAEIEAEIDGRCFADVERVSGLGARLWPEAASVLRRGGMLGAWSATDLSDASCAPVSGAVAALLTEAGAVLALRADAAAGLLPPDPGVVRAMLARAGGAAAMAMLVAVLLDHVPSVGPLLVRLASGPGGAAVGGAMETAAEVLLQQLEQADVMEVRIASGSLAEAGASAGRMVALLGGLEAGGKPERRRRVRALRERLDGCCLARFASGVEAAFPGRPAGGEVRDLETAARGLRVLETDARGLGSGAVYDRLLLDAAERVVGHDALAEPERVRLVEILRGPEAALAMLAERG